MRYPFLILCCVVLIQCCPKTYDMEREQEYIKVDSALWAYYEQAGERLMEQYANDEDSLYIKAVELEAYADQKNRELAIEYAATPSGLRRCFMLRLDLSKDMLKQVLSDLPRDLRRSECASAIQEHIATKQIEVGMAFCPFEAVCTDGSAVVWEAYRNKNMLLIYGGLGCMGPSGRRELASLRHDYSEEDLAIVIYYAVDSLDELQKIRNQYATDYTFISELMPDYSSFKIKYGAQSTPTCFLIGKDGCVQLKTVGFDVQRTKSALE